MLNDNGENAEIKSAAGVNGKPVLGELATKRLSLLSVKYIIPAVLGMLFMSLQTIIDGFFVGRYAEPMALGALNIVMPVFSVCMALCMIIAVGGQSLMSIYLGRGKENDSRNVFKTAGIGILVIGGLFCLAGVIFAEPIARALGASVEFLPYSAKYLRIMAAFAVPFMLWLLCDFTLRVLGKPHISLAAMIIGALLNILLDFLFLGVFRLGIGGAALATGISMSTSFAITFVPLFNKKLKINIYHGVFKPKLLLSMSFNGMSEGVNAIASAIVILLINLKLMALVGNDGVIAYTAILYVTQIGFSVLAGIADGLRPIISYNYGAQNRARLRHVITLNAVISLIVGILLFLLLTFAGKPLVSIFVTDPNVVPIGVNGAKLFAYAFLFSGFNLLMSGYFTAINFPLESALVALMRGLVFIVIGIFTLPIWLGINGVWLSMPFSEIMTFFISGAIFLVYYKKKTLFYGKFKPNVAFKEPPLD